jgi:hypothetical protein
MKNQTVVSYHDFMLALYQLCIEKRTGTMFIAANDHHTILMVLHDGDIVACRSGVKEGNEAIQLTKLITSGQYSFDENLQVDDKSVSLSSSTDVLLKELAGKHIENRPLLALCQLCVEQRSGTMFIAANNCTIQFELRNGKITACRSGTKEGDDAIQVIGTIASGRYSFDKNFFIDNPSTALPFSTEALLKQLAGNNVQNAGLTDDEFSAIKTVIEEELTDTVGPIAGIICEDYFDEIDNCDSGALIKLINDIAMEVEEGKREKFKDQLIEKLKIEQ